MSRKRDWRSKWAGSSRATAFLGRRITASSTALLVMSFMKVRSTGRAAYGATAETYPTQVAAEDAEIRLVRLLADLIVSRIELTYGSWPE